MVPPGSGRTLVVIGTCALALAAAAEPPLPAGGGAILVIVASVAAWTSRSALFLLQARRGVVPLSPTGRPHRLGRTASAAAGSAAVVGLGVAALFAPGHVRAGLLVASAVGMGAALLFSMRQEAPRAPRTSTRMAWLVADTALPAGVLAGAVGACVAYLRLHGDQPIAPETLARHLAGTTFLYALLVGFGGFLKAWTEQRHGLVLVERTTAEVPGPVVVGLILGVAQLFVVPLVIPPLPFQTVVTIKAIAGFGVGGSLSLLGAMRGARKASGP